MVSETKLNVMVAFHLSLKYACAESLVGETSWPFCLFTMSRGNFCKMAEES